jgi:four helix bundle protein
MQDHHNLLVWQKAHALALRIDALAEQLLRRGRGVIASQTRRASLSIPSNIAEGCQRSTDRDFARFVQMALASAGELESQIEFVIGARVLPPEHTHQLHDQIIEVRKMLYGLLRRLRGTGDTKS